MTINTQFFTNWQDGRQPSEKYRKTSPNLMALRDHLTKRWGGQYLGGYGTRPVRGGAAWSTHAFGAAIDWRWCVSGENVAQQRAELDREVIPFLINNSLELGIQAVHDYYGSPAGVGRVWRSVRLHEPSGWKAQKSSSTGMGQTWAQWLHIEVYEGAWGNPDPVENRFSAPAPAPVPQPAVHHPKPTLKLGSTGSEVRKLQEQLLFWGWARKPFPLDSEYGAVTEIGVKQMQRALGATIDGLYGPRTAERLKAFLDSMASLANKP